MSVIKSSTLNLYDGSGSHNFKSKVSSTKVDLQSPTLPLAFTAKSISFKNYGGEAVYDIVNVLKGISAQLTDINTNIAELKESELYFKTLILDIELPEPGNK